LLLQNKFIKTLFAEKPSETIKRVLSAMMTDELGVLCSWAGRKYNKQKRFCMKDLRFIAEFKNLFCVKYRTTEKDFEDSVLLAQAQQDQGRSAATAAAAARRVKRIRINF
jgi:hypothetical protein